MPSSHRTVPQSLRHTLVRARTRKDWSQTELGKRVGIPQMHVSSIETGKVVPRFDTLLDYARALDYDILLVPRDLVPVVEALIRDRTIDDDSEDTGHLYALEPGDEES